MRVIFALLALASLAQAAPPVIVYRSAPPMTVVSPLTPPTARSGQTLLSQINNTMYQRRVEHQILTSGALYRAQAPVFSPQRSAVRIRK